MTFPLTAVGEERLREILACPFCGGVGHRRTGSDFAAANYSVFCVDCFASTPVVRSETEAIAAWNRRSPVPEGGGLRVKPLDDWQDGGEAYGEYCDAVCARYIVRDGKVRGFLLITVLQDGDSLVQSTLREGLSSADEAKAAAQADYAARILSALASPAPVKAEAEVVAMTVIDPDAWEPCSPSYLERGGNCDAPRVWNSAENNHYHPKLAATPSSGGRREALEEAVAAVEKERDRWPATAPFGYGRLSGFNKALDAIRALANTNPTGAEDGQ